MRFAFAAVFVSLLCSLPFVTSAQTAAELQAKIDALLLQIKNVQAQIAGNAATPRAVPATSCPALTRLLAVGSRGDDVTALQDFLRAKGYMSEESTGYFGAITEAAVKKLQVANSIVSSGTIATTGYGAVGPKTRSVIATLCSASVATPATAAPQCADATSPMPPSVTCAGTWEKLQNLGCHVGWRCILSTAGGNKSPVITGIQGPSSLAIDSFGTWTVAARDPEGGSLTYSYTWGDEGIEDILNSIAGIGGTFTSAASATHAYAKAGRYTLQVSVKDSSGAVAVSTVTVTVRAATAGGTVTTPFNPIAAVSTTTTAASCITPWGNQVVSAGGSVYWQPFFTDGAYYATTSPLMKCDAGMWLKCDAVGANCQVYTHPTSTPSTAALPSYTTSIGQSCSPQGASRQVHVPPGTQLCQWLNCRITTQVETVTLKCSDSGWTDYANY